MDTGHRPVNDTKRISISKTIQPFNKNLTIEGDKSLSIRWALLASQASGKSKSLNLIANKIKHNFY